MGKWTLLALWLASGACGPLFAQTPTITLIAGQPAPAAAMQERPAATLGVPTDQPPPRPMIQPPSLPKDTSEMSVPMGRPAEMQPSPPPPMIPPAFVNFNTGDAKSFRPPMAPGDMRGKTSSPFVGKADPAPPPPNFPTDGKTDVLLDVKYTETHTTLPRPVMNDAQPGRSPAPLLENLAIQFALDGSREPADLGLNGNFGFRAAFNWGIPVAEDMGIGMQIGTALNYSRTALPLLRTLGQPTDRLQSFTSLGLFRRTDSGWNYGFVYDFRFDEYYTNIDTSQWRAHIGKNIDDFNEIGVFGSWRDRIDQTVFGDQPVVFRPVNQIALFWRHLWEGDIVTRVWVGLAEEHGGFFLGNPAANVVNHAFTFGLDFHVPLTCSLALFGEAHFITPNDTGAVTATLGIAWYPGASAKSSTRSRFAPLLPLANNPFFTVDAQAR